MTELDNTPPKLPKQRRFELLKGLVSGFVLIGIGASGLFNEGFIVMTLAYVISLALVIILFCKKRPKMACGILLAYLAVPLLIFGACFGMMNF